MKTKPKSQPHPQLTWNLTTHSKVWLGTALGLLLTLIVAAALIAVFYTAGANTWEGSELRFEGAFSLVACVIISVVGAALLRIGKMQDKWRVKLAGVMEGRGGVQGDGSVGSGGGGGGEAEKGGIGGRVKRWMERYTMFALPFVTVLREGVEAVVFIAGVTFSAPASAVPLAVVVGLAAGALVGFGLYK